MAQGEKMSNEKKGDVDRGGAKLSLKNDASSTILVKDPLAEPYRPGSQRARIWQVISLMNGITVEEAHRILAILEPNVQGGRKGRPLGWVADAMALGLVKLRRSAK